jgi:DNA-damage-inducible protein J
MPKAKTAKPKTTKANSTKVKVSQGKVVGPAEPRRQLKTDMIRVRIDPTLKDEAEQILGKLGLSSSDAIRLFYSQITLTEGLPFPVKIPNAETRQAMNEADAGEGNRYASAAEMFKKMGL